MAIQNEYDKHDCPVRFMWQDEGRFGRIVGTKKCWAPPCIRPDVPAQIVREYTYAYVAVSPTDGVLDSLILPVANTYAMSVFLAEVSSRHEFDHIVMFMDKAGWHRSKDLIVPKNITISYLPPYSPELNPAEHIWDEIREKWFQHVVFQDIDGVEDRLVDALRSLSENPKKVHSLTAFPWIINNI